MSVKHCLVFVTGLLSAIPAAQVRDSPTRDDAALSGIVLVDDRDGAPLRQALVSIQTPGDRVSVRLTTTDEQGRFRFDSLPARPVSLSVSKPGYVTTYYGSKTPGGTIGTPLSLSSAREISGIEIRVLRGGVIAGTVTGPTGRPLPNVTVRLGKIVGNPPDRHAASVSGIQPSVTDGEGHYRLYGLPPGQYIVFTDGPSIGLAVSGAISQPTETELIQLTSAGTSDSRTPPLPAPRLVRWAPIFFPSTPDVSRATVIDLPPRQELLGIDLSVSLVHAGQVSGTVVDETDKPVAAALTLVPMVSSSDSESERIRSADSSITGTNPTERSGADGSFSIPGVPPGQYLLNARATTRTLWTSLVLTVSQSDLNGVVLKLKPAVSVRGSISMAASTSGLTAARFDIRLTPTRGIGVPASTKLDRSADFVLDNVVPGWYRLEVIPSDLNSVVTSTFHGSADVTDREFEISTDDRDPLKVVVSGTAAEISGLLLDSDERPTSDLYVMLFNQDRQRWFQGSRYVASPIRPATDGSFKFAQLPPGGYYLAVLADVPPAGWFLPEFLQQVVVSSISLQLGPGDKRIQNLKIAGRVER